MASSKKVENVDLRPEEEKFLQANLGNRGKQELKAVVRIFFGGRYAWRTSHHCSQIVGAPG